MSFVDLNVCISEAEADYIRSRQGTAPAMVIAPQAGGIEPSPATLEGRRDMLFVAGWMAGPTSPNVDALAWFVDEVLPIIRSSVPWATVRVTGAAPPLNVRDMANDGVRILGYVHDLDVAYREARVVVAPIRFGAGVKLKTVEALEYGLPTVATVIGAEGIDVGAGNAGLVVADDPAAYAAACVTLLTDDAAWMRARAQGA